MGRRLKADNLQSLTDEWRERLLAHQWSATIPARRAEKLGRIILLDPGELESPGCRTRLKHGLVELFAAISTVALGTERPDDLDQWIHRRLLNRGTQLLISEERRTQLLAQQRDVKSRQTRHTVGLRSMTITMAQDAWDKVDKIRDAARGVGAADPASRSKTLEQIVRAHDTPSSTTRLKITKRPATKRLEEAQRLPMEELFDDLPHYRR